MRAFWVNYGDKAANDAFNEFFAFETAFINAKIVKWFGFMWYIVLGIMTSGYHGTSDMDCLCLLIGIYLAILMIITEKDAPHKVHPIRIFKEILIAIYGDDVIISLPPDLLWILGADGTFPKKLAEYLKKLGLVLKPGETKIYTPTHKHKNVFFTQIDENDEIRSEGVHMLQRYFVKYDVNMKALHPNSKTYAWILPWRKTGAYATRLATDARGFLGKEGRADDRDMNPILGAYVKAFGLLLDAGPNRKAHKLCKEMMKNLACIEPEVPKVAHIVARGELSDICARLDIDRCAECLPAINDIYKWSDEQSYNFVVSKMGVSSDFFKTKF